MAESPQEAIDKILQRAVLDGVLRDGEITRYSDLIKSEAGQRQALETLKREAVELKDKRQALQKENQTLTDYLKEWTRREDELLTREKEMTKLECRLEAEQTRVSDHKSMFQLVFRNTEVRRNVFTAVPGIPGSGDYSQPISPYVSEDTQTETPE